MQYLNRVCCTVGEFEQKMGQDTVPEANPSRGAMIVGLILLPDIAFCKLSVVIWSGNIIVFTVQDRGGGMQMALRSEAECTTMQYLCALGIHGIRDLSSPGTLSLPLRSRSTLPYIIIGGWPTQGFFVWGFSAALAAHPWSPGFIPCQPQVS